MSGRKTNTHCHMRLMNAHEGSSVTPGAFQSGMTLRVAMSAMNVMKKDAPSSAPRIGRNESDRNSKNESIHATLPRTPFARSRALMASRSSGSSAGSSSAAATALHLGQRLDVVVDILDAAADHDLEPVAGLGHRAHDAGDRFDGLRVDRAPVSELESQSGRAVGEALDIRGATYRLDDL